MIRCEDRCRLFCLISLFLLLLAACTDVSTSPTKSAASGTPRPTAAPIPTPAETFIDYYECYVGLAMNPGHGCTYNGFSMSIHADGQDMSYVISNGKLGTRTYRNEVLRGIGVCLNRFCFSRSGSTWTIDSLP